MRGIDTTFLVAHELAEVPVHSRAREVARQSSRTGQARFALVPQVLMEFLHVVTDPRRFQKPLAMEEAVARAEFWWDAKEVRQVFPGPESVRLGLRWIHEHRLGRKRLLDTQLAASLHQAGIHRIITQNRKDFEIFGVFQIEELGV
jgi:predicted nucleic acid-binding protein